MNNQEISRAVELLWPGVNTPYTVEPERPREAPKLTCASCGAPREGASDSACTYCRLPGGTER